MRKGKEVIGAKKGDLLHPFAQVPGGSSHHEIDLVALASFLGSSGRDESDVLGG